MFLTLAALPLGVMVSLQLGIGGAAGLYRLERAGDVARAPGDCRGRRRVAWDAGRLCAGPGRRRSRGRPWPARSRCTHWAEPLWRSAAGLLVRRQRRRARARGLVRHREPGDAGRGSCVDDRWRRAGLGIPPLAPEPGGEGPSLKYRGSVLGFAWSILIPLAHDRRVRGGLYLRDGHGHAALRALSAGGAAGVELLRGRGQRRDRRHFGRRVPAEERCVPPRRAAIRGGVVSPYPVPAHAGGVPAGDAALYQVPLSPRMLLFPIFLVLQVTFITGLALGLSAATALFRDVRHLVDVGVGMLFWATPIIYEMKRVPEPVPVPGAALAGRARTSAPIRTFLLRGGPRLTIWAVCIVYASVRSCAA